MQTRKPLSPIWASSSILGHILRKVYNCRERKILKLSNIFTFPVPKNFSFPKNFRRPPFLVIYQKNFHDIPYIFPFRPPKILMTFFSHFLHFLCFSPSKRCRYNCTTNFFRIIHSQNFTLFTILFNAFPLVQFKIYNYNCTIPILQLQTTFYNCTNCQQLHVKICPAQYLGSDKATCLFSGFSRI